MASEASDDEFKTIMKDLKEFERKNDAIRRANVARKKQGLAPLPEIGGSFTYNSPGAISSVQTSSGGGGGGGGGGVMVRIRDSPDCKVLMDTDKKLAANANNHDQSVAAATASSSAVYATTNNDGTPKTIIVSGAGSSALVSVTAPAAPVRTTFQLVWHTPVKPVASALNGDGSNKPVQLQGADGTDMTLLFIDEKEGAEFSARSRRSVALFEYSMAHRKGFEKTPPRLLLADVGVNEVTRADALPGQRVFEVSALYSAYRCAGSKNTIKVDQDSLKVAVGFVDDVPVTFYTD